MKHQTLWAMVSLGSILSLAACTDAGRERAEAIKDQAAQQAENIRKQSEEQANLLKEKSENLTDVKKEQADVVEQKGEEKAENIEAQGEQQAAMEAEGQKSKMGHHDQASVREAQQRLKELGFYSGSVDGIAGKSTTAAVRKYQQDQKIAVTGHLDSQTMDKLTG